MPPLVLALSACVLCEFCAHERACRPLLCPLLSARCTFLCAKIWLFGKLVVLLHCKEQKYPFVDVPWCNGSTRVFGSLSPRSNRSGTTSPSPRVLQSFPACKALFPQQCLYDTAFFVYVRKGWWIGTLWYITLCISVCSYCTLMVVCFVT